MIGSGWPLRTEIDKGPVEVSESDRVRLGERVQAVVSVMDVSLPVCAPVFGFELTEAVSGRETVAGTAFAVAVALVSAVATAMTGAEVGMASGMPETVKVMGRLSWSRPLSSELSSSSLYFRLRRVERRAWMEFSAWAVAASRH